MEANGPDPETMVTMVEAAMTLTDNKQREEASAELKNFEDRYPIFIYANTLMDALMRQELIAQQILHLRV